MEIYRECLYYVRLCQHQVLELQLVVEMRALTWKKLYIFTQVIYKNKSANLKALKNNLHNCWKCKESLLL